MVRRRIHTPRKALELYVLGMLGCQEAAEVESHVTACAECESRLMAEASLEIAFEQIAHQSKEAARTSLRAKLRTARQVAIGTVGMLALAASCVMWIGTSPREASHAAGASEDIAHYEDYRLAPASLTRLDATPATKDTLDGG